MQGVTTISVVEMSLYEFPTGASMGMIMYRTREHRAILSFPGTGF